MRPKGTVKTMSQALTDRGIDPATITEGRGALDRLVDDTGAPVKLIECLRPRSVLCLGRVSNDGVGDPFRINSSLSLAPSLTEVQWLS